MTAVDVVEALDFERDRWGRPLIVPAGGGKPIPYVRASSAAKTVEDTYNLELWARRNIAYGMARDPSLVARVIALGGDPSAWDQAAKAKANKIHEAAADVALAHKAADIGTAVHRMTEIVDRGEPLIAGPYEADIDAYRDALALAGLEVDPAFIECRLVCDALEMAGTADRILTRGGGHLIADIKTGDSVDYGSLGWAAQLAAYAHSSLYDIGKAERLPTPAIDRTTGIIIHLPAGQGRCTLYEIDLVAGFRAAQLANEIRAVRREAKRWISPLTAATTPASSRARHPSTSGRRERLLARYRALKPEAQLTFRARQINPDDLDAVEAGLDDIEGAAAVLPAAVAPTPAQIDDTLARGAHEGDERPDGWEELEAAYAALGEPMRQWVADRVREASGAGVPIHPRFDRTVRRYSIYRGMLAVAATFDGPGDDLEDVMRELLAQILGESTKFPTVTVGRALGALSAPEAEVFAATCVRFADVSPKRS